MCWLGWFRLRKFLMRISIQAPYLKAELNISARVTVIMENLNLRDNATLLIQSSASSNNRLIFGHIRNLGNLNFGMLQMDRLNTWNLSFC